MNVSVTTFLRTDTKSNYTECKNAMKRINMYFHFKRVLTSMPYSILKASQ
jgi:hypothetical protein